MHTFLFLHFEMQWQIAIQSVSLFRSVILGSNLEQIATETKSNMQRSHILSLCDVAVVKSLQVCLYRFSVVSLTFSGH